MPPVSRQLTEKESKRMDKLAALGVYRDQLRAQLKSVKIEMDRIEFNLKQN